jgi:hypothetical protein
MLQQKKCSGKTLALFDTISRCGGTYAFITNQIASATITATIAHQTTGVTFFELPLRGESFGA